MDNLDNMLEKAIELAVQYHKGQRDKAGHPYILHPLSVMANVNGVEFKIVAVLHDILEDTPLTEEELSEHFPEHIVRSVKAITKTKGDDYFDYLKRVKADQYAKTVKIADIKHNISADRLRQLPEKDIQRLSAKYCKSLDFLESG